VDIHDADIENNVLGIVFSQFKSLDWILVKMKRNVIISVDI